MDWKMAPDIIGFNTLPLDPEQNLVRFFSAAVQFQPHQQFASMRRTPQSLRIQINFQMQQQTEPEWPQILFCPVRNDKRTWRTKAQNLHPKKRMLLPTQPSEKTNVQKGSRWLPLNPKSEKQGTLFFVLFLTMTKLTTNIAISTKIRYRTGENPFAVAKAATTDVNTFDPAFANLFQWQYDTKPKQELPYENAVATEENESEYWDNSAVELV